MTAKPMLHRLTNDVRGATMMEFALLSPVLLIALLGIFDLGFNIYTTAQMQGAIQQAARDSTIEGSIGKEAIIDGLVSQAVHQIVPDAVVRFERKAYTNFSDIRQPEDYTDLNEDSRCDDGEPFEDANGNGMWDEDRGMIGNGSARDAKLYRVSVTYPRVFPVGKLIGISDTQTMEAMTVLRNQPFGQQAERGALAYCP